MPHTLLLRTVTTFFFTFPNLNTCYRARQRTCVINVKAIAGQQPDTNQNEQRIKLNKDVHHSVFRRRVFYTIQGRKK